MILRVFKVVWFFSLAATLAVFMYVYASLPDPVVVHEEQGVVSLSKEALFYIALAIMGVLNALVFAFNRLYRDDEHFISWFFGLITFLNLFVLVALSFLSLYNSGERFDYPRIGVIIYGSIALMGGWTVAWPVYVLIRRVLPRREV